jgi:hypothetical protein
MLVFTGFLLTDEGNYGRIEENKKGVQTGNQTPLLDI